MTDDRDRVVPDLLDEAVRSTLLSSLLTHWRSLRGADRIPRRSSFDPMRIPKLLPSLLFLGAEAEGSRYRIRVVGTRLGSWFGRDLTGLHLDEATMPEGIRGHILAGVESGAPFVARGQSANGDDIVTAYELMGLPMADESGCCSFFLAGVDLEPPRTRIGRT